MIVWSLALNSASSVMAWCRRSKRNPRNGLFTSLVSALQPGQTSPGSCSSPHCGTESPASAAAMLSANSSLAAGVDVRVFTGRKHEVPLLEATQLLSAPIERKNYVPGVRVERDDPFPWLRLAVFHRKCPPDHIDIRPAQSFDFARVINVNLLTTLAYQREQVLVESGANWLRTYAGLAAETSERALA